jgi:tetratricopeptide (TPR) repeat protein
MDNSQYEEIKNLLKQIAASGAAEQSRLLFDAARNYQQSNQLALAVVCLEAVTELQDPLYTANSLMFLTGIYKRIGDFKAEAQMNRKIAALPPQIQRFVYPGNLGIIFMRLGDLDKAYEYYQTAAKYDLGNPSTQSNIAELMLLRGEPQKAIEIAEGLAARAEPNYAAIGRMLKAVGLSLLGKKAESETQFRLLGNYFITLGSFPGNLEWDFRDTKQLMAGVKADSKRNSLVLEAMSGLISFDDFRQRWQQLEPALQQ